MKLPLSLAAALIAALAPALHAQTFDAVYGSPRAAVELLRGQAASVPSVTGMQQVSAEPDCREFKSLPGSGLTVGSARLESTEYTSDCGGPGYGYGQGGGYSEGRRYGRDCWNRRPGVTTRRGVTVELSERAPLWPWESETVEACLYGRSLDVRVKDGAYKYKVEDKGNGRFILVPGKRHATRPDADGLSAKLEFDGASARLLVSDRWATEYAGERTTIRARLVREVSGWSDETVVEADFTFNSASGYVVDFSKATDKVRAGSTYYVKWGFKRVGAVSRPDLIDKGTLRAGR